MDTGTVKFNVGGQIFEMLEQTVRAKPDALLCTLLDDPATSTKDASTPIFVEADPGRFRYILDWYRYGSIRLPHNISLEEMQRECAFFQLPDDLSIKQECMQPAKALKDLHERVEEARAPARHLAAGIYAHFLAEIGDYGSGSVHVGEDFCKEHNLPDYRSVSIVMLEKRLRELAEPDGWQVEMKHTYGHSQELQCQVQQWKVNFTGR